MREKFKQQLEEMYRQMVIMGSLCQQAIAGENPGRGGGPGGKIGGPGVCRGRGDRRHGTGDRGSVYQTPAQAAAGGGGPAPDHRSAENGDRSGADWGPGLGHCGAGPVYS